MKKKLKLLLIDDDPLFAGAVRHHFEHQYEVFTAENGKNGIQKAEKESPDIILLDILMPDMDGIAVCKILKERADTKLIPIIVVTSREDDDRRSEALLCGAQDLVSKPLRPKELSIRIQNVLRIKGPAEAVSGSLVCGNLRMDLDKLEVRVAGRTVNLTSTDLRLLKLFVMSKGSVLNREKILDAVWPDKAVNDRVVDNRILSLRKRLRGFNYNFITVYGVGYCLREKR